MSNGPSQGIYRVAIPVPLPHLFDYLPPESGPAPRPGNRVLVRFGPRRRVGVVVAVARDSQVPERRLQRIQQILDPDPPALTPELVGLLDWCAGYYQHPPGEVVFNALPPALRRAAGALPGPAQQLCLTPAGRERLHEGAGRAPAQHRLLEALAAGPQGIADLRGGMDGFARLLRAVSQAGWVEREALAPSPREGIPGPELTDEQQNALDGIRGGMDRFHCHLLDGVTGSGKTEIYLELARPLLEAGRQVLVLVPEIGLTPQLLRRFTARLGVRALVSHSGIAAGARLQAWAEALRGTGQLFLGTRSALFLPLKNPGLIIMDEAHDPSFKQQDGFRYSARDVAVKRAAGLGIPIVLGSATPSLESLHNAERGRYTRHRLRRRATGAPEPAWRVMDLRQQVVECGISGATREAMARVLERGEQVLVFLNRRGYAPVLLCHSCGWHADCPRCDSNMTWHRGMRRLVCHHCEERRAVPQFCPECAADALEGAGEGTEQLEHWLRKQFNGIALFRVDRDRMRRQGELEAVVEQVRSGRPCLLVGTQMLAKGHHFPKVTLVVIVNLDQALYSADFRAMERMGQVLVQVAGRAGRADHAGTVILQTHHPDHPALIRLIQSGYGAFAQDLLAERRMAGLPPCTFQAVVRAEARDRDAVLAFLEAAVACCPGGEAEPHGPFPAMMERRGGRYRWYLMIQSGSRACLQSRLRAWLRAVRELPQARRVRWSVDVDPQEF